MECDRANAAFSDLIYHPSGVWKETKNLSEMVIGCQYDFSAKNLSVFG